MIPDLKRKPLLTSFWLLTSLLIGGACGSKREHVAPSPAAISIAPQSGSGASKSFTIRFSNTSGSDGLIDLRVLINSELSGAKACYVYYDLASNSFLLVNDSGEGSTRATLGTGAATENGQCIVSTAGAASTRNGAETTVSIPIKFKPSFAGAKNLYLSSSTRDGTAALAAKGTWTVTLE